MVAIRHEDWVPALPPTRPAPSRRPLTVVPDSPACAVIYRRRRLVAIALVAIALAFVVSLVSPLVISAPASPAPISQQVHVVQPGDTLWSIAASVTPQGGDVRAVVDELAAQNGGAAVAVGQRIVLP